eukprot:364189-Chlamydomonas_euryale.AAC.16
MSLPWPRRLTQAALPMDVHTDAAALHTAVLSWSASAQAWATFLCATPAALAIWAAAVTVLAPPRPWASASLHCRCTLGCRLPTASDSSLGLSGTCPRCAYASDVCMSCSGRAVSTTVAAVVLTAGAALAFRAPTVATMAAAAAEEGERDETTASDEPARTCPQQAARQRRLPATCKLCKEAFAPGACVKALGSA